MAGKNYYYLVSGLKEYFLDSDTKGFDAVDIIREIKESVSKSDRRIIRLFYTYYDIENIINLRAGRKQFSKLGYFGHEELAEELEKPTYIPSYLGDIITEYNNLGKEDEEADINEDAEGGLDTTLALERNLFAAYYKECAKSSSKFLRKWAEFDRTLRNISAAYAARRKGISVADVVIGDDNITKTLSRSSAADFGLKGEVSYVDQIMTAVTETTNLIDKEHKIDLIRWNMAEELTQQEYFNVNAILAYLVKVNIIYRWATLDPKHGKEMLHKFIEQMSIKDVIGDAESK